MKMVEPAERGSFRHLVTTSRRLHKRRETRQALRRTSTVGAGWTYMHSFFGCIDNRPDIFQHCEGVSNGSSQPGVVLFARVS